MATTTTSRNGLIIIGDAATVDPSVLRATSDANAQILDAAVLYDEGPIGSRLPSSPGAPGIAGRHYRSTDENAPNGILYLDIGVGWIALGSGVDQAANVPSLRTLGTATGQALPGDHASVTNARTPTAHAASHKSGGSDQLYRIGTTSVSTGGDGTGSTSVAHGLGATPTGAGVLTVAVNVAQWPTATWDGTNVYFTFAATGRPNQSISFTWIAFR